MNFSDRLKELRNKNNLTQSAISEVAKVTDRAIRKFESGENSPNMVVLIALADYFDISIDYLVGRSDDPARH